jgi:Replication protein A OB domain
LWNGHAVSFNRSNEDHPVVAVKGAKVSGYNGVSLNTLSSTLIMVKFTLFKGSFTEAKFVAKMTAKATTA